MIAPTFGIVFVLVGLFILYRIWNSERRALSRAPSKLDESVFLAMDLQPSALHRVQARSSKPADTFRSIGGDLESEKPDTVLAPTGIHAGDDFDEGTRPGLLDGFDRSRSFPRLPPGKEEAEDPEQENLGF